jgi:hypothetical protein
MATSSKKITSTKNKDWQKLVEFYENEYGKIQKEFQDFNIKNVDIKNFDDNYFTSRYLTPASCMHGFDFNEKLGQGAGGTVYNTEGKGEESLVVKTSVLNNLLDFYRWEDEEKLSKKLGEYGIGPHVVDSWVCDQTFVKDAWGGEGQYFLNRGEIPLKNYYLVKNVGMIVSEKLDKEVDDWIRDAKKTMSREEYNVAAQNLLDDLTKKLQLFYDISGGYLQIDLSTRNNSMVKNNGSRDELYLIDFGYEGLKKFSESDAIRNMKSIIDEFTTELAGDI